mgnify:CR=1 FL=1
MGAVMGALIALDAPADQLIAYAREAFAGNPTGDVSLMPITSLIQGRKLKAILEDAVEHLGGPGLLIEDTWKTFFCVAANYSKAYEMVLRRGPLARSIRASCARLSSSRSRVRPSIAASIPAIETHRAGDFVIAGYTVSPATGGLGTRTGRGVGRARHRCTGLL